MTIDTKNQRFFVSSTPKEFACPLHRASLDNENKNARNGGKS